MSGTTLQFSTEYPFVYASDSAMIAVPSSNFPPGTMVLSLESGLYMFDNSTLGVGPDDLLDSDNLGLFRKSTIPFIYVDDNSVISNLNVGPASIPDNSITNVKINSAAGISFSKLQALPANNILAGVGGVATACSVAGDVAAAASGTTLTLTVPSLVNYLPLAGGTMLGNLILNADPTISAQAATKNYVDITAAGLNRNAACLAASAGSDYDSTYNNGTAGVGATLTASAPGAFSLDGQAGVLNGRYLIKDQTASAQNGIYTLTVVGNGGTNAVLTRASDYNTPVEINNSGLIPVLDGTVNNDTIWLETAPVTTIGTDPIVFSLWAKPSLYLQVANNLSDVASASTSRTNLGLAIGTNVQAWSVTLDAVAGGTYTGAASITTLGTIVTGVWHAGIISGTYGGTGVNNGSSTITIGGNISFIGSFTFAGTVTGNTAVTFPTSGTLATTSQIPDVSIYMQKANNLSDVASASTSRTNLGLAIGTDVQAHSATLDAVAGGTYIGDSSITNVGNISSGAWQATPVEPNYGGTGVNNPGTIIVGGNVEFNGSYTFQATLTNNTSVTFPTSGTLLTTGDVSGFLLAANNLSDVASASTSRTNLGLAIGTNVQAFSSVLSAVAGGTYAGATSITTVGSIATGTWNASIISGTYGGTGVNNGNALITVGNHVTFIGNFVFAANVTGTTNITFPTSGTLATTSQLSGFLVAANNLSDVSSASTARTNLGLAIGTNVQAFSSTLSAVAGGTYTGSTSITTLGTIATGVWDGTNIDAAKIADGSVSNTEFQYLDGTTSNIQAQINAISSSDAFIVANYTSGSAVTGDGTVFTINGWTEITDTNNAFNSATGEFTLPAQKTCSIDLNLTITSLTLTNTSASILINSADLGTFVVAEFNPWAMSTSAVSGQVTLSTSLTYTFASADVITFSFQVGGSGANSVVLSSARVGVSY